MEFFDGSGFVEALDGDTKVFEGIGLPILRKLNLNSVCVCVCVCVHN